MKNQYQEFFKKAQQARAKENPNNAIKAKVRQKISAKVGKRVSRSESGMNWMMTTCSIALLGLSLGYFFPDELQGFMSRVEINGISQATAADAKAKDGEKVAEKSAEAEAKSSQPETKDKASEAVAKVPDVRTWSKEELSIFDKLNERKSQLDARESELNQMEEELQKQKVELEAKMRQLEKLRNEISAQLQTRIETDKVKVDKLVQVYSTMKAQQAAKVIESLNEDLAIEILDQMKKKNAAEILNLMDSKKAKKLSEMMAGYKVSQ